MGGYARCTYYWINITVLGMLVRFVAIVNPQNEPIYFRSADEVPHDVEVNHQFVAEMSLDFIEQQSAQLMANLHTPLMVVIHDGIAVYAMLSNTRTKYILGIEATVDRGNVDEVVHAVADAFIAYQCNPFSEKTGPIKSPEFDKKITKIIENAKGNPAEDPQEPAGSL